jgi:hypothetical protein
VSGDEGSAGFADSSGPVPSKSLRNDTACLYLVTGNRISTSPPADMSPLNTCIAGMAGV